MKTLTTLLLIAFFILLIPTAALSQFKPGSGEIKGYMIAEWYWITDHHTGSDDGFKGNRGLWFRRIYFTYNNKLSDTVKMRLRFEMNSPQFESNTLVAYVKDAWIDFKLADNINLKAGILDPPIFTHLEGTWGYRSLEKTPLDLYKWTSSRDFAVGLYGGNKFRWGGYFGQGSSNKGEADNGKKVYGHVEYADKGLSVTVNGHYEHRKKIIDEFLFHPYVTYSSKWGRVGFEYAYRDERVKPEEDDEKTYKYNLISAFVVFSASEKIDIIFRFDKNWGSGYYQNWKGSGIDYVPFADYSEPSFLIGAVSLNVIKNVWLIPNIKYTTYADPKEDGKIDEKPGDDMYVNLTLWFKF
jgi:hypothetical protein